jgi:large subunit ribosomal protein L30
MEKLQVKLIRSLIGGTRPQLATAQALGLRKIGDVSQQPDNAATKGKLRVLAHLIEVSEGGAQA